MRMTTLRDPLYVLALMLPLGFPFFQSPVPSVQAPVPVVVPEDSFVAAPRPYFDPDLSRPTWLPLMVVPVTGAHVPTNPELLPGAVRSYRGGVHEGVDFRCLPGLPVHASAAGWVLAVDDRPNLPAVRRSEVLRVSQQLGRTPAEVLAILHGKHIVLCHGERDGRWVTTSYSHLGCIRAGLVPGQCIARGEVIGWTGCSGTSHAYDHGNWGEVHFELHVDGVPLGTGLSPAEAGALYTAAFRKGR